MSDNEPNKLINLLMEIRVLEDGTRGLKFRMKDIDFNDKEAVANTMVELYWYRQVLRKLSILETEEARASFIAAVLLRHS